LAAETLQKALSVAEDMKHSLAVINTLQVLTVVYQMVGKKLGRFSLFQDNAEHEAIAANEKLIEESNKVKHTKGEKKVRMDI
jgi:hypothetical protein